MFSIYLLASCCCGKDVWREVGWVTGVVIARKCQVDVRINHLIINLANVLEPLQIGVLLKIHLMSSLALKSKKKCFGIHSFESCDVLSIYFSSGVMSNLTCCN